MKNTILKLLLCTPLVVNVAHAADWPQYRGATGDGVATEPLKWKPAGLSAVWKVPSDGGFSSFSVADGRAFTLSLKEIDGASQEVLVAHNAASGVELWSVALQVAKYDKGGNDGTPENKGGDGPRSTPAIVGKTVVVLSSELSLRCFEAATGKEV